MHNTILNPQYTGPFNPEYGYLVYDPETQEMTAFAFHKESGYWDYSTWTIVESGSN